MVEFDAIERQQDEADERKLLHEAGLLYYVDAPTAQRSTAAVAAPPGSRSPSASSLKRTIRDFFAWLSHPDECQCESWVSHRVRQAMNSDQELAAAQAAHKAAMDAAAAHPFWAEQSHLGIDAGGTAIEQPLTPDDIAVSLPGG
jgi:hypothetical protein